MKCEVCRKNIEETFLKKLVGTIIKDAKGKKRNVCSECQQKLKTKERIMEQIK